jgi:hypothetical protein
VSKWVWWRKEIYYYTTKWIWVRGIEEEWNEWIEWKKIIFKKITIIVPWSNVTRLITFIKKNMYDSISSPIMHKEYIFTCVIWGHHFAYINAAAAVKGKWIFKKGLKKFPWNESFSRIMYIASLPFNVVSFD